MSSSMDGNRDIRKQIGCMNGISQLFDHHHYLTSWRISSHTNKKLLKGTQCQLNSQHATRAAAEKVEDVQKMKLKQRVSMDSSRASYLSSSSSSTLSSLDSHGTAGPTSLPQKQISVQGGTLDLRDVVKGSMYREARCLHVKIQTKDKSGDHVMKHIDSPRPLQQHKSGQPETTASDGSKMFLAKFQESTKNSKDARLTLARYSYDGRESRENIVLPRLSLDSKASSMKCSFLESKSNLPRRDYLQMESENYSQVLPLKQEPGGQNRSSSVVAKLMGLDDFPDTISAEKSGVTKVELCPKKTLLSKSSTTTEKSKKNQVSYSPRASQNNPTSQSPRLHSASSITKPTEILRFPVESAPWRQQNPTQGSQKKVQQSRKAATTITQHLSSSVYGEVEKRVTELEFKKSGKDLRALKQILEAMHKTREESDEVISQRSSILEDSFSDQNPSLSMCQSSNNYHKVPPSTRTSKHSVSYIVIKKPTKVIDEKKLSSSNQLTGMGIHRQRIQTLDLKHEKENSAHRQRAKDLTPRNNNLKYTSKQLPSIDNRTTPRTFDLAGTLKAPQVMKAENCSGRLRQNLPKSEGKSNAAVATSSDTSRIKIHSKKNIIEKGSRNKNSSTKSKYFELSDDQLSDFSGETRFSRYQSDSASVKTESNNILASHIETEFISLSHSINPSASQHQNSESTSIENIPAAELAVTMQEQPSPVSVLDSTFYGDDSPSPIKRISMTFRDQSPSPDDWHLENLDHFIAESKELAQNQNEMRYGSLNPNQRYINKILHTSGLLKGASFIPMASQFLSSGHVINPDMFNVLEQIEGTMPRENREFFIEKNSQKLLDQKVERKIVFDMVNEMLVQKVTSGKRRISPLVLVKEICQEMGRLSGMVDENFNEEEDRLKRILSRDMVYQSEDWAEYSGEVPALVLDIERQIFKDLVNEVVSVDHTIDHHRKQLFTM